MNMFCHKCGKKLTDTERFCRYCGADVSVTPTPSAAGVSELRSVALPTTSKEQLIFRLCPAFYPVGSSYFISAILSLAAAVIVAEFGRPFGLVLALSALFFVPSIYKHVRRNSTNYTLTSAKIEIEYGLFSKTVRNIPLRHIQDVTVRASLSKRLIGIGDVLIDSASAEGKIPMLNIRNPRKHADMILHQLHRSD